MKVDDLIGSLITCEIPLDDKSDKKNKGIALQSSIEDHVVNHVDKSEDNLVEVIFLLAKQLSHVLKKLEKRLGSFPSKGPKSSDNAGTSFPKARPLNDSVLMLPTRKKPFGVENVKVLDTIKLNVPLF